jgi:serine/threonine protein kinase
MSINAISSWSSTSTSSVDLTPSPCELINGVALDWSGRGTSHVEYSKSDTLPLIQGRFLGYGMHGGVYETTCNGIALAWKRKYCAKRMGHRERREIEIIKRLQHPHIIRLVGTYTHGPFLGLLLWPVATCDFASLLEDIDWLQKQFQNQDQMQTDHNTVEETPEQIGERQNRLQSLGLSTASMVEARDDANAYLERTMGCIAGAVAYLHEQEIKHKDLKPSNILLSSNGLWVTDFGTATNFSVLTTSATEDGERGTPKYFAPEIAVYAPSGRAADIFSLGCIFLEIITLCIGYSLEETMQLRSQNDRSFHANLKAIHRWFSHGRIASRTCADEHMLGLVRTMMQEDPNDRPTAAHVEEQVALIGGLATAAGGSSYSNPCCDSIHRAESVDSGPQSQHPPTPLEISIGNTHEMRGPDSHAWVFFVTVGNPDLVEKVSIYLVFISVLLLAAESNMALSASKFSQIVSRMRTASVWLSGPWLGHLRD